MSTEFPPVPVHDLVLVITHLQNDFWHPDGRGYGFTRDTLPFPDTKDRIAAVIAACRTLRTLPAGQTGLDLCLLGRAVAEGRLYPRRIVKALQVALAGVA